MWKALVGYVARVARRAAASDAVRGRIPTMSLRTSDACIGRYAKTVVQSSLMLATVQPWAAAVWSDFSAPAV